MNGLQGKRTLITSGMTGIGLETAKQFLAEGARVAMIGRNSESLAQEQLELSKEVIVIESDAGQVGEQR